MDLPSVQNGASRLELTLSIHGSGSKAAHVELRRKDLGWIVTRVRHGS